MKKLIIPAFAVLLLSACTRDLTSLNDDPKHPVTVPSASLFTKGQLNLSNMLTTSDYSISLFRLIEQQWQETTYTQESYYDFGYREVPDTWWNRLYSASVDGVLITLEQARVTARTDIKDPGELKNDTALIDLHEVYAFYTLVTTFGNIPYSQALNPQNAFPVYDDAATIYKDLLARVDQDIAALDENSGSYGSADLIFGGDISKWKKFANSFKLKLGILLADSDPATAKSAVEAAAASDLIASNDDNTLLYYLGSTPNTNPVWTELVYNGRQDYVACSTILSYMTPYNDPRLPYYFTLDANGGYSGGAPGVNSSFATFSKPGGLLAILKGDPTDIGKLAQPDFPADLLDYSEVEFYLAEAAERGYSVPGTAEEHYNNAITASIEYWGGSSADAATYLARPDVAYTTAAGTWQQKIGTQAYLGFYNRGFEAWTEQRRLDYPVLPAPANAVSGFPVRLKYPVKEQNVNEANLTAASSAIGGDALTTKLWFDKN